MQSRKSLNSSARGICAVLGVGSLFAATGCDAVDGVLAAARLQSQEAVQDRVGAVIGVAIDGVLGGVLPGTDGA